MTAQSRTEVESLVANLIRAQFVRVAVRVWMHIISPMIFHRTMALALIMCAGITKFHYDGRVSAEHGGMVIAFTILWLIGYQVLKGITLDMSGLFPDLSKEKRQSQSMMTLHMALMIYMGLGIAASRSIPFAIGAVIVNFLVALLLYIALPRLGALSSHAEQAE